MVNRCDYYAALCLHETPCATFASKITWLQMNGQKAKFSDERKCFALTCFKVLEQAPFPVIVKPLIPLRFML